MIKTKIIHQLLKQFPHVKFSARDLKKFDRRYRSKRILYIRFGYQWKDESERSRRYFSKALKKTLKGIFEDAKGSFPESKHRLNYASLRARAGKPVLNNIVFDLLSADLLFFDLTHLNPNVFLELGIAIVTKKNLFLLLRKGTKLPSDLAGLTYCNYNSERDFSLEEFTKKDIRVEMKKVLRRKMKAYSGK